MKAHIRHALRLLFGETRFGWHCWHETKTERGARYSKEHGSRPHRYVQKFTVIEETCCFCGRVRKYEI